MESAAALGAQARVRDTVWSMAVGRARSSPLTLVFTCAGRRVELLQAFRAAAARLGVALRLVAADNDRTAPALYCVDEPVVVPKAADPAYIPAILELVRRTGAAALIPTIDTDLQVLSDHRAEIGQLGCVPLIAEPEVIRMCRDKVLTYAFLKRHGIDTPETFTPAQLAGRTLTFPMFMKPRAGSASLGAHRVNDQAEYDFYLPRAVDPIIQEFVPGVEHTLDVYVGLGGVPRCVVPRARWQIRGGEVSKGAVVKALDVMNAGRAVVAAMGPSVRGLVTLQCIVNLDRRIRFIEINPRFGGGAPLGIAAGANYPLWIIQELLGDTPTIAFDGFKDGLAMLRYDWSVFVPFDQASPASTPPLANPPTFL